MSYARLQQRISRHRRTQVTRRLRNLRIRASYVLPKNIRITESKTVAHAGHAEPIRKFSVRKPERLVTEIFSVGRRIILKWEFNKKV